MRQVSAELIQDREAVGIDATPVIHLATSKPRGLRQLSLLLHRTGQILVQAVPAISRGSAALAVPDGAL